ncbi:uncharacterized protein M437DRAFT_67719 [Aureobasidium melanogenum CBS 110374]|uniref:Uncharacterized protein n=1 Tax=Aureobasidium melanogenum (strain CBS 110374) TaxID=1043003 RepID=A0A074VP82_AURM1|nr:uncharacterized protein M437DRAFT_67719 [Aureobasidium melanogenum CBS 110374]KEQ60944.1 hypothetical protein M437DRAFT_67719 [Aureobasidium melanogenum CBS 110374]
MNTVDEIRAKSDLASTTAALSRMAYQGSYYLLWTQQTHLFNEIDLLKYHIADIERQLLKGHETLNHPDTKRLERRKAKWAANSQRKYLTHLERALHSLLRSLSACQAQIARIHSEVSWQTDKHANPWTMYHGLQDSDTIPTLETHQPRVRSSSPDSGFSEPALYAQPFDLDLTEDQTTHVFSHELQHPLPLTIRTQVMEQLSTPVRKTHLSPSADDFTPTPKASHKAISPLAVPFSPFVFAKTNPPGPNSPINARPLFTQPIWTSSFDWSEQIDDEMTPVSPRAKTEEQDAKKRPEKRYSIAAIELIESRLKHKRQISEVSRRLMAQG